MSDNIMQDIATQLQEVDNAIYVAKDLISALKEVGEDVTEKEAELRNLEKRKVKWNTMLQKRGY